MPYKKGDSVTLTEDYEIVISPVEMTTDVFATIPAGTVVTVDSDQSKDFGFYGDFTEALKSVEGVADDADPISWINTKECSPV